MNSGSLNTYHPVSCVTYLGAFNAESVLCLFFFSRLEVKMFFFSLNGVFPLYRYTIIKESSMKTTTLPTLQLLMVILNLHVIFLNIMIILDYLR